MLYYTVLFLCLRNRRRTIIICPPKVCQPSLVSRRLSLITHHSIKTHFYDLICNFNNGLISARKPNSKHIATLESFFFTTPQPYLIKFRRELFTFYTESRLIIHNPHKIEINNSRAAPARNKNGKAARSEIPPSAR